MGTTPKYKRILLKVSGEQLAGEFDTGIDPKFVGWLADEVKKCLEAGCQVVIIAGGGNMVRGAEVAGNGIRRVTADQMGMLSGLINAMATTDIFESHEVPTRCLSNIFAEQAAESYSYRLAEKHLENNRVVIIAGGTGRPYFTHDTAAVSMALELDCQVVLKATNVKGVFTKDPKQYDDAQHLPTLTYQQAVENPDIQVMDKAAMGMAMEHKKPIIVFDISEPDGLKRIAEGEALGTMIS